MYLKIKKQLQKIKLFQKSSIFFYKKRKNRIGVIELECYHKNYVSLEKQLESYSELSQSLDEMCNIVEQSSQDSKKIFQFAESIYILKKNIKECNSLNSKLSESEKKILTQTQDYISQYLSINFQESLLNIIQFRHNIKNLLKDMRALAMKNYELRLEESIIMEEDETQSYDKNKRNGTINDSAVGPIGVIVDYNPKDKYDNNHINNDKPSHNNNDKNKEECDKNGIINHNDNKGPDPNYNLNNNKDFTNNNNNNNYNENNHTDNKQHTITNIKDNSKGYGVASYTSNSSNNKMAFSTNLSRKEKMSIYLSKISREKQSLFSIREFEEIFSLPRGGAYYQDNSSRNDGVYDNNNVKPKQNDNNNIPYLSPPPPLPNRTKTKLEITERESKGFNLEEPTYYNYTNHIIEPKKHNLQNKGDSKLDDKKVSQCDLCVIL